MAASTPDWLIRYWPLLVTGAVLGLLLLLVLLMKLAYRFDLSSPPQRTSIDRIPKYAHSFFSETGQAMGSLGFEFIECVHLPQFLRGAEGYIALWVHRQHGSMAACTTFRTTAGATYI